MGEHSKINEEERVNKINLNSGMIKNKKTEMWSCRKITLNTPKIIKKRLEGTKKK